MSENVISENSSEKPRRGRPPRFDPTVQTAMVGMAPGAQGQTRRSHLNLMWALEAVRVLNQNREPSFSWLLDETGPRVVFRQTIMAEIGRLEDPDAMLGVMREVCRLKPPTGEAVCMIRAYRLGRGSNSETERHEATIGNGVVGSLHELVDRGEKFGTIYADPPWRYGNQATRAATDDHYTTMSLDEICAEPVGELAAENAHLHLWTTNGFLFDAQRVMEAWGFQYRSCFVWVKPQMGLGNYWRVSHEYLLFGIRGKPQFLARDEMSWGQYDRGAHSAKPDEIRQKIEKVSPGPYLEMYGRQSPLLSAWTVYGNQVERSLF